jgi:hypothetical protein
MMKFSRSKRISSRRNPRKKIRDMILDAVFSPVVIGAGEGRHIKGKAIVIFFLIITGGIMAIIMHYYGVF